MDGLTITPFAPGFDVAGPGLFAALGAGLAGVALGLVLIVFVEGLILRFMGWGPFGRALLSSALMNLASSVVGIFYAPLLGALNGFAWVFGAFILSVLLEGLVLAVQRKVGFQRAVWPALVVNGLTYLPIAVVVVWGLAGLGLV